MSYYVDVDEGQGTINKSGSETMLLHVTALNREGAKKCFIINLVIASVLHTSATLTYINLTTKISVRKS